MPTKFSGQPSAFPYIVTQDNTETTLDMGGLVSMEIAAQTLAYGDYVFRSVSGRVEKSLEAGPIMSWQGGVVVGGAVTNYEAVADPGLIGQTVATIGQRVLVQYTGNAWVASDSTTIIQAGQYVYPGQTTAGRLRGHASPPSYAITAPVMQRSAGTATLAESLLAFQTIISGTPGTTTAAGLDTAALSGTVVNGQWAIYVFRVATNGTTVTSAKSADSATQAGIIWPTAGASTVATYGLVLIHPTGTGNFVGNTTALDDATVVPNALYFDIYTRRGNLGMALSNSTATAGSAFILTINQ